MRDSNPRSWDQNPVPYRLANPQQSQERSISIIKYGIRLTFGEPETSRLKASFQRKISLRIAAGNPHPDPGTRTTGSPQICNLWGKAQCFTAWPILIVLPCASVSFYLLGKSFDLRAMVVLSKLHSVAVAPWIGVLGRVQMNEGYCSRNNR